MQRVQSHFFCSNKPVFLSGLVVGLSEVGAGGFQRGYHDLC